MSGLVSPHSLLRIRFSIEAGLLGNEKSGASPGDANTSGSPAVRLVPMCELHAAAKARIAQGKMTLTSSC